MVCKFCNAAFESLAGDVFGCPNCCADARNKTRPIDRAVFRASKLIEAGQSKGQAIRDAALEYSVGEAQVADYFKLVLLPHERNA
jgi:hypothetical protein